MIQLFLEIWYTIPIGWRYVIIAIPIGVGSIASILTLEWPPAAAGAVISLILWLLPGPSDSEKRGYNF